MNIKSVTLTNKGYIDYTHNLLNSIKKFESDVDLRIFTLDDESFNYFQQHHNDVIKYDTNVSEEFVGQKSEGFGNLMIVKFEIIYKSLNEFDYVLYIDGDIVVRDNIMNYLLSKSKNKDIVFLNDKRPSKPNLINMCAGFMFIKSSKKTQKFFNPENINSKKFNDYTTHDQTYINRNLAKFNYASLPLDLFPNGPHYYKNYETLKPKIIHFNYLLGDKKKDEMIKYNQWFL